MSYDPALKAFVSSAQTNKKKIVLVTGVFDVLHYAHVEFLQKAKAAGDLLVVGLESDLRVKSIKGPDRPINAEIKRLDNLLTLKIADFAFVLPKQFSKREDYLQLLQLIKPAVLAVSSHTAHLDSKSQLMKEVGGELKVVMEFDPGISTTKVVGAN